MELICDVLHFGYYPAVLLAVNIVLIAWFHDRKHLRYILPIFIVACVVCRFVKGGVVLNDFELYSFPTTREFVFQLVMCALLCVELYRAGYFKTFITEILLAAMYVFCRMLYLPLFDVIGVLSFVIVFIGIRKSKSAEFQTVFVFTYPVFAVALFFTMGKISWKGMIEDNRNIGIFYLASNCDSGFDGHEEIIYQFSNIEDTRQRLTDVFKTIFEIKDNCTITFLEDSLAAYTFVRSNVTAHLHGNDNLEIAHDNTSIGVIRFNREDNHFYKPIEYKISKRFDFQLISESDTTILFSGSFNELNFAVLCGFQKYIESGGNNYIGKNIFLEDNSHNKVMNIFYHNKDMYDIRL